MALSPDGTVLAAVRYAFDEDVRALVSSVVFWQTATGKEIRRFKIPPSYRLEEESPLAFAPDSRTLAVGLRDGRIGLLESATGRERGLWVGHSRAVTALAFSSDGRILASTGKDGGGVVCLWDAATGKAVRKYEGHRGEAGPLVFSPDGALLASAGADTTVLVWQVPGRGRKERPPPVELSA